jgi:hypothetical protein
VRLLAVYIFASHQKIFPIQLTNTSHLPPNLDLHTVQSPFAQKQQQRDFYWILPLLINIFNSLFYLLCNYFILFYFILCFNAQVQRDYCSMSPLQINLSNSLFFVYAFFLSYRYAHFFKLPAAFCKTFNSFLSFSVSFLNYRYSRVHYFFYSKLKRSSAFIPVSPSFVFLLLKTFLPLAFYFLFCSYLY